MQMIQYRAADVNGIKVLYREACGPQNKPARRTTSKAGKRVSRPCLGVG